MSSRKFSNLQYIDPVAQMVENLIGDSEVVSSIQARPHTLVETDHFYGHSLPFSDSRRAIVSF